MSLQLRRRQLPPEMQNAVEHGTSSDDASPPPDDSRNVFVTSGIHRGRFPIGGGAMRVGQARELLRRLMPIPDEAVAVINGQAVSDDEVIGEDVTQVSFVKPSAVKG